MSIRGSALALVSLLFGVACSSGGGAPASATNPTAFTLSPARVALTLSQTQQFTATVPGGGTAAWSVDGIPGGSGAVGTVSASGLYTPPNAPGTHTLVAASKANPAQSGSASIAVTDLAGVFTYHNDVARTGQNLQEYALTPKSVSSGNFGRRWSCTVDGDLYAQPLYVANLAIGGGVHNVVLVATEHDSVYAFDADNSGCVTYWQVSALRSAAPGATTIPVGDTGAGCLDILTEFGITGTPVIDPASQTLYFVAASKESGTYVQRLHALSLATGAERPNSPVVIQASVVNQSGNTVSFAALWQNQRPALALVGGGVEIAWSSHCDYNDWWGWVMRYDATSLAQTAVFNVAPDGFGEGGIWMSGGAPAIDSSGALYLTTGNGDFDTNDAEPVQPPNDVDFSMSFLNLDAGTLAVQDFYTPSQESAWSGADLDISSAGVTVLPDGLGPSGHPNLLVGSDKQAHLWLLDRALMGGYSPTSDDTLQLLTLPNSTVCAPAACVFSTPTFYQPNSTVYLSVSSGPLMALPLTNGLFGVAAGNVAVASSASTETYGYPGPTAAVSASPAGNAIVWALDTSANGTPSNGSSSQIGPAILRAYPAGGLGTTLYDSSLLPADTAGNAVKFAVPIVANGHVYVAGAHQLTVYGLAP